MAAHAHLTRIDEVEPSTLGDPPLGGTRRRLGASVGLTGAGLSHYVLAEGERPFPVHLHLEEEETAYVLAGSGLLWLDGATHAIAAGDAISHLPRAAAQAYVGGPDGLELLVLSSPMTSGLTYLPRIDALHADGVPLDRGGPLRAPEAALGPLELPAPTPRPATVVALAAVPAQRYDDPGSAGSEHDLGDALGVRRCGLRHTTLDPGALSCPPHWHTAEEECFVVLAGSGTAWLGDDRLEIGPGSVLGRPPRSGVAHALQAGPEGLTYLAFGTRVDADLVLYPRSSKVNVGAGVLFRVDPTDYWDGERP